MALFGICDTHDTRSIGLASSKLSVDGLKALFPCNITFVVLGDHKPDCCFVGVIREAVMRKRMKQHTKKQERTA